MIRYYKLFEMLKKRGITKSDLEKKDVISWPTIYKLEKGESVRTDTIDKLCEFLQCQPGDIMEYVDRKEIEQTIDKMNDMMQNMVNILMQETGKSKDEVLTDFQKEIPNLIEQIKTGKFIIPNMLESKDSDEN